MIARCAGPGCPYLLRNAGYCPTHREESTVTVPPWMPDVQRLPDGTWQPLLRVGEPVATPDEARERALFLTRHADARLRDVAAHLDAPLNPPTTSDELERPSHG